MTSRPWHIVRWFGFLAIGAAIAIGGGMRFRANDHPADAFAETFEPADNSLAAQAPRDWLAQETTDESGGNDWPGPPELPSPEGSSAVDFAIAPPAALDPNSPEAERAIDEVVEQLAGFAVDVGSIQIRTTDDRGDRRFVFSCDVPTGSGAEAFVGEGPDPPSAARQALSRIREWAAAPGDTILR